jgi:hypothetical protein
MKIKNFIKEQGIDKMSKQELGNQIISVENDIKELVNTSGSIKELELLNMLSGELISLYMKK